MKLSLIYIWCVLSFTLLATSCLQDKCSSLQCENGICVDGQCVCQYGYEGESCEEHWYVKFLGSWNVEESLPKDTSVRKYMISVQSNRIVDTFKISGFADTLGDVYCVRNGSTTFNIIGKDVDSATKLVSGQGTINSTQSTVTGVYSFSKDDKETAVNFKWTK